MLPAMETSRCATIVRKTTETDITLTLRLDGEGLGVIDTGIPFFDHMLTLFARHSGFDLEIKAIGDLAVDYHHTVEDIGLALGQALKEALGAKVGIVRYGFFLLPMDETLVRVALDLSGRPALVYEVETPDRFVRDFHIGLFREFFQAVVNTGGLALHVKLETGREPHHVAEATFKGFARALAAAVAMAPGAAGRQLPSTKGVL